MILYIHEKFYSHHDTIIEMYISFKNNLWNNNKFSHRFIKLSKINNQIYVTWSHNEWSGHSISYFPKRTLFKILNFYNVDNLYFQENNKTTASKICLCCQCDWIKEPSSSYLQRDKIPTKSNQKNVRILVSLCFL